jgi:hypothetical protein
MSQGVELAELIHQLRIELGSALTDGKDQPLKFECGPIALELTITVEKHAESGGKVRFWVVDGDASANLGSTRVQRISMTLTPRIPGQPTPNPLISGAVAEGEE